MLLDALSEIVAGRPKFTFCHRNGKQRRVILSVLRFVDCLKANLSEVIASYNAWKSDDAKKPEGLLYGYAQSYLAWLKTEENEEYGALEMFDEEDIQWQYYAQLMTPCVVASTSVRNMIGRLTDIGVCTLVDYFA